MKYFYLFLVTLFLFPMLARAQGPGLIKGKVLNAEGVNLSFATVILYQPDSTIAKTGFTNEKGQYILTPLQAGSYFLSIQFTDLGTYRSDKIELAQGETVEMPDIILRLAETSVDEVEIVARKPLVEIQPDKTVFNVAGNTNAIGENAFDLLRKAPGVIIDNNDNIVLMGNSGVRIFIDGKPSPLSVADLANMLKGMQSDQIEAIEIITNPSARYDAEGTAGIINIRLKKNKNYGTNGSFTLGAGHGATPRQNFPKYNGSFNFNSRGKHANLFGNYSGGLGTRYNFTDFFRIQSGLEFDQTSDRFNEFMNNNLKLGLDLFLYKKHTIGFLVNGFVNTDSGRTVSITPVRFSGGSEDLFRLDALSFSDVRNNNLNTNINYVYTGSNGTTLNVDLDYGIFRNDNLTSQPNLYFSGSSSELDSTVTFRSVAPTDIDIYTLKADYKRNAFKGSLEAGIKLSLVNTDNDFRFFNVEAPNLVKETIDTSRTNRFVYNENVNAAYAIYQRQIKKWNISVGLRAEQTNFNWDLTSLGDQNATNDSSYFNLFPSGGLTFSPNRTNMIRLNYSRRIDRPKYQDLNPFIFQLDRLTFQQGNPTLRPQYTDNVQLTYSYKYRYSATLGYSRTTGFFTRLTDTLGTQASFISLVNIGSREVVSFNVSAPIGITKWWSSYTNLNLSYQRNVGDFNAPGEIGKEIDLSRTTYNIFQQHTFTLPKGISIDLSGFYNSPSIWGANYLTGSFWMINAGAQKRILDNRATVKVSINDIFFSGQWTGIQEFGGLVFDASGGWESRTVNLNFSYNFGSQTVKKARRRKTGLQDESDRVGGSGNGPGN